MDSVSQPLLSSPQAHASTPGRRGANKSMSDRFIPTRSAMDLDVARFALNNKEAVKVENALKAEIVSPAKEAYKKRLAENLLSSETESRSRVLAFKIKAPAPPEGFDNGLRNLYTAAGAGVKPKKAFRHIPQAPDRILDAPELLDDYYLNLLDWSCSNVVAVALGSSVYLWNAGSGAITQLAQPSGSDTTVTSVSWAADGKHIAVGTSRSEVQIWDAARSRSVRTLRGHSARVGALAWNGTTLASAGRDTSVLIHDVRIREHCTATLAAHAQEVCGLKWSPSGSQLASGGNDNALHIWDAASISRGVPVHSLLEHTAAVKALAWCPFQGNLLASGGGTADRCIKFWNTNTGAVLNSIDTGSQVCALQWNTREREILSSHGYSQNQLCLWKYPTMVKMAEFNGHTARVLHMAASPDGMSVVSAGADETLRFWRAFGDCTEVAKPKAKPAEGLRSINIR